MQTLIKGGHVLDPAQNFDETVDVLIEDGIIKKLEKDMDIPDAEVINAEGMFVMPGFIDLHVHFREPGFTYKETVKTGAMAAAAGGYTTVCPMPNTKPVIDSRERVMEFLDIVKGDAAVNVLPVGSVTRGQEGKELSDIKGMKEAGICAISEDGKSVMDASLYEEGMKKAKELSLPVFAHCEDKNLVRGGVMNAGKKAELLGFPGITNEVEDVIVKRDIELSKKTGVQLHLCHCSTKKSVEYIKGAKEKGIKVTGEVCPHHFSLCEEDITRDHGDFKMNPPIRKEEDREALCRGLKEGIIDVISTDHAPHGFEENDKSMLSAPFGIVGLETAFCLGVTELVNKGWLTKMELVEKMSTNPAGVLGINKGNLRPGTEADIVIADFDRKWVVDKNKFFSKGKNTPFHGKEVRGRVVRTIAGGKTVYCDEG